MLDGTYSLCSLFLDDQPFEYNAIDAINCTKFNILKFRKVKVIRLKTIKSRYLLSILTFFYFTKKVGFSPF